MPSMHFLALFTLLTILPSSLPADPVHTDPAPPAPPSSAVDPAATPAAAAPETDDGAQQQPPAPAPGPAPAQATVATPVLSPAAASSYDRRDALPNINVYLPEGQASVRVRKLIRNVLFESQIDYRFINGDISTFLRYKYYARAFTYRLGLFDQISFPDVGSHSTKEFERVRGGLLLFEFPRNYNNRYYWLLQDDRLTFGDPVDVDNKKNNVYTKVGYQFGTQFDERLNGIVGESRGRITPVLTAFRDLGPQRFSLAAAATLSGKVSTGDYRYLRLEAETIRRTDLTETQFLVTRLHAGLFVNPTLVDDFLLHDPIERYTIPRYEMFALGGREALRAVKDNVLTEGTDEVHLTNEYFVPVFRNRNFNTWGAHWNTLYAIGYAGAGSVGYDTRDTFRSTNLVADAGLGAETSISIRNFEVILSLLYAHTVYAPDLLKGGKVSFSIRTVR